MTWHVTEGSKPVEVHGAATQVVLQGIHPNRGTASLNRGGGSVLLVGSLLNRAVHKDNDGEQGSNRAMEGKGR